MHYAKSNMEPYLEPYRTVDSVTDVAATNYNMGDTKGARIEQIMIWRRFATEQHLRCKTRQPK